jgi:hypothetical protein
MVTPLSFTRKYFRLMMSNLFYVDAISLRSSDCDKMLLYSWRVSLLFSLFYVERGHAVCSDMICDYCLFLIDFYRGCI